MLESTKRWARLEQELDRWFPSSSAANGRQADRLPWHTAGEMMEAAGLPPDPAQAAYLEAASSPLELELGEPAPAAAAGLRPQAEAEGGGSDPRRKQRSSGQLSPPFVARSQETRPLDIMLNCTRQWGKSTTTAALALWQAYSEPGSLTLLVSPTLRQSGELFQKVMELHVGTGAVVGTTRETALTAHFAGGSRIVSLPGAERTIRGYSAPHLIVVDEAARVPDELYYSVRPMLAVARHLGRGRMVSCSTPFGQIGWFYEAWCGVPDIRSPADVNSGEWWSWRRGNPDGTYRIKVTAAECPRIGEDFLAEERIKLPSWWYDQEYCAMFREVIDAVFDSRAIAAAFADDGVKPLFASSGGPHMGTYGEIIDGGEDGVGPLW